MRKVEQLGRRTFLMSVGKGTFALLSEVTFGLGRRGLAVALGGTGLATACTQPMTFPPPALQSTSDDEMEATASYLRVAIEFVNAYVLVRGQEIAIVDTGLPGSAAKFTDVIQSAGHGWDAVNHVILTHHHPDHVGSTGEVLEAAGKATIYAGAEDIPEITSPQQIQAVKDGDEVLGMQIIDTPGHTPGHISVYDPKGSLFVAGDAMVNVDGVLAGANARFTADMDMANESIKKIAQLTFETAVFGHGDPIDAGASNAVTALASTL